MSTRIMALVWPLRMPPTQKAVLVSLADQANDDGVCWPSVGTICERTCLSERAVRNALRALADGGLIASTERAGRSTFYTIHPGTSCTPAPDAPLHQMPGRGALDAGEGGTTCRGGGHQMPPNRNRTINEPSLNQKKALKSAPAVPKPATVGDQVWSDFLSIRSAKKSPLSGTALAGIEREAAKAGMRLEDALAMCCERGWQGFKAEWAREQQPQRPPYQTALDKQREVIDRLTGRSKSAPNDPMTFDMELARAAIPRN